jgi:hypothetical protein
MEKLEDKCVVPAKGPILEEPEGAKAAAVAGPKEVKKMGVQVGRPAPDFEASAFIEGLGFRNVKLSEYKGKWVVLCFYPGDFTFV